MKRSKCQVLKLLVWIILAFSYGFFNGWMARGEHDRKVEYNKLTGGDK